MSKKLIFTVVLIALVGVLVAGWLHYARTPSPDVSPMPQGQQDAVTARPAVGAGQDQARPRRSSAAKIGTDEKVLTLPDAVALFPGLQVPAASNWSELIADLSPEEREIAEVLAARYPESYTFSSVEQLEWMIAAGYPMPQEFVAAQLMSQDELLQMAIAGNKKADLLDMERYLNDDRPMTDEEKMTTGTPRLYRFVQERKQTCSPFYGYLYMAYISRYYSFGDPRSDLPELARIVKSGDQRVSSAARAMIEAGAFSREEWGAAFSAADDVYGCGIGSIPR